MDDHQQPPKLKKRPGPDMDSDVMGERNNFFCPPPPTFHGGNNATSTTHGSSTSPCSSSSSLVLQTILSSSSSSKNDDDDDVIDSFLQTVWQNECRLYRYKHDDDAKHQKQKKNPFHDLIQNGWNVLMDCLDYGTSNVDESSRRLNDPDLVPLIFNQQQEQVPIFMSSNCNDDGTTPSTTTTPSPSVLYQHYLQGSSIVLNHADMLSGYIASTCHDLQQTFPHVYANVYITPPLSQTVPAHADDRDVLIIQLLGRKCWKVYQQIPILYPYPSEQVGKSMPVPQSVLDGPIIMFEQQDNNNDNNNSTTSSSYSVELQPGDVLYMPRGYVHEATTTTTNTSTTSEMSFHVTVAIATHDWTLKGIMMEAVEGILGSNTMFRKSILPIVDIESTTTTRQDQSNNNNSLQEQLQHAMKLLQEEITPQSVLQHLKRKIHRHNVNALQQRQDCINRLLMLKQEEEERRESTTTTTTSGEETTSFLPNIDVVGPIAARNVTLDSWIRCATVQEKQRIVANDAPQQQQQQQRGLHVREEAADGIYTILGKLKETNKQRLIQVKNLVKELLLQHDDDDDDVPMMEEDNNKEATTTTTTETTSNSNNNNNTITYCDDLTVLSFVKCCVELGALAVERT